MLSRIFFKFPDSQPFLKKNIKYYFEMKNSNADMYL